MYTKKDLILHAKSYIDKLSEGINPLNDLKIDDTDVVKEERIVKCFQHISSWLYEYAQQLKKEEFVSFFDEKIKNNKRKKPFKKSSATPQSVKDKPAVNNTAPIKHSTTPTLYTEKSCETCKNYRNNNCAGLKLCEDYEYAPTFTSDETSHWPKEGDASYFKRTGRSRN